MQSSLTGTKVSDTKEGKEFVSSLAHALMAPIITWPMGEQDITKEQQQRVTVERLAQLAKHDHLEEATDFEVCLYLMTASLQFAPGDEMFHIYMHAFRKVYGPEKVKEVFGEMYQESDFDLDEYTAKRTYENLKKWIYQKQKEHLKSKSSKVEVKSDLIQSTL